MKVLLKAVRLTNDEGTSQRMKFSIKDFFSKFDHIRSFVRIWSHLLKKSVNSFYDDDEDDESFLQYG